ncbi:MAG: glycosyltransferase family 39 protein [Aggregatilineales bacterium]
MAVQVREGGLQVGARRVSWLSLVLLTCVAARLAVLLAFPSVFAFEQSGAVHGSEAYDAYAQNLLTTGVYGRSAGIPDAAIPPLYSYALAAIYALFGRGYWQVGLFHTLLDCLSIYFLVAIGTRLFDRRAGLLAGLAYALYPYLIFQNLTLIDTPLFMALLYGFLWCMVLLRERPSLAVGVLGGAFLALAALTRPVIVPLAPLGALWFLLRLSVWESVRRLLPVAAVSAAVVAPWLVWTYQLYSAFVPIATNGGMNFWFGNNPLTIPLVRNGYHPQWIRPEAPLRTQDTRLASDDLYQLSLAYLRENPQHIPELLWVKFLAYWSIDVFPTRNPIPGAMPFIDPEGTLRFQTEGGESFVPVTIGADDPVAAYSDALFDVVGRWLHRLYFGPLLLLALCGAALSLRQWREVSLVWLAQLAMTVFYVIYIPATRYRVPTDPLLFLFSAHAALVVFEALRQAQVKHAKTA